MAPKGQRYINNGIIQTTIKDGIELPKGFVFGKLPISDKTRKILSDSHKGIKPSKESIDKMRRTFIDRYGVSSPSQLSGVSTKISHKLSSKEVQDKMKKTCLEKYGFEHASSHPSVKAKMRRTNFERHGDQNYNNKEKEYETRKRNGTLGAYMSGPEKHLLMLLRDAYSEEDVVSQYMSSEYPFKADFYIKSIDTYIEYHGNWTHGGKPFDPNDDECLQQLDIWKNRDYKNAIYTWTDLDVRKRSYKDKINLIIYYPEKQDDIVCSFMKIKAELDSYRK